MLLPSIPGCSRGAGKGKLPLLGCRQPGGTASVPLLSTHSPEVVPVSVKREDSSFQCTAENTPRFFLNRALAWEIGVSGSSAIPNTRDGSATPNP